MLRPDAKMLKIKEQMINDLATGLMLVFRLTPSGEPRQIELPSVISGYAYLRMRYSQHRPTTPIIAGKAYLQNLRQLMG